MEKVRILLVDDHPMAREAMKTILSEEASFRVIAEARTAEEAIRLTKERMPDIILMDIHLPDKSGIEATRLIKNTFPYVKIIMVTVSDNIVDLFESIKNGAQGYLIKQVEHDSWIPYIKSVMNDDSQIDEWLAMQLLQEFREEKARNTEVDADLSDREYEILTWVAQGLTNKEISEQLDISEYTVKNHLKNLFQKLHLNNRVQLAKYAYEHGVIPK